MLKGTKKKKKKKMYINYIERTLVRAQVCRKVPSQLEFYRLLERGILAECSTSSARLSFPMSLVKSASSDSPTAPYERQRLGTFAKRHAPLVRVVVYRYIENIITHRPKSLDRG
jgi:hypothetical protein